MNLLLFVVNLLSFVMLFAKSDVPTFAEFDYYQVRKRPTLLRLLRTFSFVREASDLDPGTWTWFGPKCDFRTRPTFDGYICGQGMEVGRMSDGGRLESFLPDSR